MSVGDHAETAAEERETTSDGRARMGVAPEADPARAIEAGDRILLGYTHGGESHQHRATVRHVYRDTGVLEVADPAGRGRRVEVRPREGTLVALNGGEETIGTLHTLGTVPEAWLPGEA